MGTGGKPGVTFRAAPIYVGERVVVFELRKDDAETVGYLKNLVDKYIVVTATETQQDQEG